MCFDLAQLFHAEKDDTQSIKSLLLRSAMTKSKSQRKGRRNRRRDIVPSSVSPPQFATNHGVRNYRVRYRITSGLEATYDLLVIARTMFLAYATNTTVVSMCQTFRLRRVEAWCAADADQTNRSITLGFNSVPGSILNTRLMQKTDTAFGVSDVAHVAITPPRNSAFAWWFTVEGGSSPGSIQVSVQNETVLDIVFDADFNIPSNAVTPTAPSAVTVSSPTPIPGVLYFGFWNTNAQPQGVLRIS